MSTKIKYQLADGQIIEIEVPDEVADVTVELETEARRERWRDKKRAVLSLNELGEKGYEPSDSTALAKTEESVELMDAISKLTLKQQDLVRKFYFEGKTYYEIAEEEGVSWRSIYYRLETIHKNLKKLLD